MSTTTTTKNKKTRGGKHEAAPTSVATVAVKVTDTEVLDAAAKTTGTFVQGKIAGNICAVYLHVKRPTGRPQAKSAEVEVPADDSTKDKVKPEKGQMTNPCWRIDINERWKKLDANRREIDAVLDQFSVSFSVKGERLVPMSMVPTVVAKLDTLRQARAAIAHDMFLNWTTITEQLKVKFPDVYETQIADSLPNPATLTEKTDVYWILKPLTPMGLEEFDLSQFNPKDAAALIDRNRDNVDKMFLDGYQAIFDGVFVQLAEVCTALVDGKDYFKGRKNDSPVLEDIFNLLSKAAAFRELTSNPEKIGADIEAAKATLKQFNVKDLREKPLLQEALRQGFTALKESLRELTTAQPGGRVARELDLD